MAMRERLLDNLLSQWQRRDPMDARDPQESAAPDPSGSASSVVGIAIYRAGQLVSAPDTLDELYREPRAQEGLVAWIGLHRSSNNEVVSPGTPGGPRSRGYRATMISASLGRSGRRRVALRAATTRRFGETFTPASPRWAEPFTCTYQVGRWTQSVPAPTRHQEPAWTPETTTWRPSGRRSTSG